MQMEMTQRDKKLLMYLGLIVVIVCFGYWGVRPLAKGIIETDEAIEIARNEKEINELKRLQLPMYEIDNEELEEGIIAARANYYPMMSADQIDKMMTGMVLGYNLYAYDLSIGISDEEVDSEAYKYAKQDEDVEEYFQEFDDNTANSLELVDEYAAGTINTEQMVDYNPSTGIYVANINMRVGGDEAVLQKLIDDLSTADEKQLVRAYSWEDNSNIIVNSDGDYEYVSERCIYLTLDIYMCEE